jgi:low temperature requirement protein LtrA
LLVGEEPLWLAGAFIHDEAQLALWIIAMIIELLGVLTGFPVPRLGRSRTIDHTISGEHMAKRCRLFVLLALAHRSSAVRSPGRPMLVFIRRS